MMSAAANCRRVGGPMWVSRPRRCVMVVLVVLVVAIVMGGGRASAAVVHPFLGSLSVDETPAGSVLPFGVAVDNSSSASAGDVYVTDGAHLVVDRFEGVAPYKFLAPTLEGAPGEPFSGQLFTQDAVNASGNLFAGDQGASAVDEFGPNNTYIAQVKVPNEGFPWAVAVDPSGEVLVAAGSTVYKYNPATSTMNQFATGPTGSAFGAATGVAVDDDPASPAYGHVYVADVGTGVVDVFGSSGEYLSQLAGSPAFRDVVDPATGDLYVSGGSVVDEYSPTGTPITHIDSPTGAEWEALSVGINATSGSVYVGDGVGNAVDVFGRATIVPDVTGVVASGVQQHGVTVGARVDPAGGGEVTSCYVEYGLSTAYGETVPCSRATPYAGVTVVSTGVSGLEAHTAYHFRVSVNNASGVVVHSNDGTFETREEVGPPIGESVTWIGGPHDAVLRATVKDFGVETACEVEYVSDAQFTAGGYTSPTIVLCAPAEMPGREGAQHAVARLAGLAANTTYHFRFVLSNAYGVAHSADQTLATFGITGFSFETLSQEGQPYTQAGGHPYSTVTNIDLKTNLGAASGTPKDITVQLPPGLIGNPQATAKCTRFAAEQKECSGAAEVGIISVYLGTDPPFVEPLFNVVPPRGVAAEFSARLSNVGNAVLDASVRTGLDYGLDVGSLNIPTNKPITRVSVTFWGVPADPAHDAERRCPIGGGIHGYGQPPCEISAPLRPLLRNPTSCAGPLTAAVQADAYQAPGEFQERGTGLPAMTGCDRVPFRPSISVQPESTSASSPSGVHVDLHLPQEESAGGLAEADLKNIVVTLPEGVVVNPSAAGGLAACSSAQVDLHGSGPADCPDAAKVGSVEIDSPLVDHPLKGEVYVASPGDNPFGSLLAVYIAVDDPVSGVVLKVAGHVEADPVTGRLVTRFDENPRLPFEDLKLEFFGGPRAVLATPPACGTYTVNTDWTPWSTPQGADAFPSASFSIVSGPNGTACGPRGFAPAFSAGTPSNQADTFSPLSVSFSRADQDQNLGGVQVTMPPGVSAILKGVERCGEPQAGQGTCGAGSLIGHVSAAAGVGPDPFWVQGGQVFLTGPYKNAPFGLSIVVPAVAGPFNLGNVVVRAAVRVDPDTAQVSVVSDALPTILQGIPLQVRQVNVTVDRPGFMFNPTDCEPLTVIGTLSSAQGAPANVSSHFQAANCAKLPFNPTFTASTVGHASKANGTSLDVKVSSHGGPQPGGGEANIAKVKVALPIQLPSRLETLQKACLDTVFNANPAACPAGSNVGSATAVTPILAKSLSGPAYLVSHGGAAFPDLEVVLQGEGVELILDGKTNIKKGITTSTFDTVPDAPVSSFELKLPTGRYSVLGAYLPANANYNFCSTALNMPTTITGQNGAVLTQTTKIAVLGCSNALSLVSHSVKGRNLSLSVSVPGAGKLKVSGKGLSSGSKTSKGRETLKLTIHTTKAGKLQTKVKLVFTTSTGRKLSKSMAVKFKK